MMSTTDVEAADADIQSPTDASLPSKTTTPKTTSITNTNNGGGNKGTKKGKKRKLNKTSREELYIAESKDRYHKLRHACSKLLHKEGKVVKSFMCQKIGKELKAAQEKGSSNTNQITKHEDSEEADLIAKRLAKTQKRIHKLEQKLEQTKKFELAAIVDVGLKRLGVLNLDPDGQQLSSQKPSSLQTDDPFYKDLIESMLLHKRLSSAMDELNDKVTDFRQWSTRRQQMLMGGEDHVVTDEYTSGKKKRKKMQLDKTNETLVVAGGQRHKNMGGHEGTSGLFIGSLSGMPVDEDDQDGMGEAEYGYDDYPEEKKKNRPGQRARRAKAMAIEAKKAGRTWNSSINWREKKPDSNNRNDDRGRGNGGRTDNKATMTADGRHNDNIDSVKPRKAEQIAQMGKSWKEEGNAHPSWAAAAAQKSQGIQAFQGKKITFD